MARTFILKVVPRGRIELRHADFRAYPYPNPVSYASIFLLQLFSFIILNRHKEKTLPGLTPNRVHLLRTDINFF